MSVRLVSTTGDREPVATQEAEADRLDRVRVAAVALKAGIAAINAGEGELGACLAVARAERQATR